MRTWIVPLLLVVGCASATPIPDDDRAKLEAELPGKSGWLAVSMYEGPFWQDDGHLLLSPTPPEELELVTDLHGDVVRTRPETGVVPAGRRVRIERVELPTGRAVANRALWAPRYNPWVYVSLDGEKRQGILVLRADLKSHDQFVHALSRLVALEDPNPKIDGYGEDIKAAIGRKQVVRDMDADAVTMAWGPPEHRSIDEAKATEVWTWSHGKRQVTFNNGRVVSQDAGAAAKP